MDASQSRPESLPESLSETSPAKSGAPPELAEGYYVDNFDTVLRTVVARDRDLLAASELTLAESFFAAPEGVRRLYVRLVMRKGPLFRRDLLDYPEIGDLDLAVEEAIRIGLLDRGADASIVNLLALLRLPELRALAREQGIAAEGRGLSGLRRAQLEALLLDRLGEEALAAAVTEVHRVLRPLGHPELLVFRLLFFGNLYQSWSEFVVRDLGIVRYEDYELRRELRLFDSRAAIDHSLLLRLTRGAAAELVEAGRLDLARSLAEAVEQGPGKVAEDPVLASLVTWTDGSAFGDPQAAWHPVAKRHADRLFVRVARDLERAKELEAALNLYSSCERPPARERRCRVLVSLGRTDEALELCRQVADAPREETERAFAGPFLHRLEKRLGLRTDTYRRRQRPKVVLELPAPEPGAPRAGWQRVMAASDSIDRTSVEWRALRALEESGKVGIYSENWLWRSLFGLAFWDIVFAPIPGAFQHPFQSGPLDLFGPDFRPAREAAVVERLDALRAETDLATRLWPIYESKKGIANGLVVWHEDFEASLRLAMERLPGSALAIICDRLSRDPGRYRRGFPDLLIFDSSEPEVGGPGFELLEVKGPGDQLRPEQKGWIDFLNEEGIPAKVMAVVWSDGEGSRAADRPIPRG